MKILVWTILIAIAVLSGLSFANGMNAIGGVLLGILIAVVLFVAYLFFGLGGPGGFAR